MALSLRWQRFLADRGHFCFRRSASKRSRCALIRLISSSSAAISSSRRALFELEESLLRIFSNTFSTGSLVVLAIIEPLGRKEALSSDNHSTTRETCRHIEAGCASRRSVGLCRRLRGLPWRPRRGLRRGPRLRPWLATTVHNAHFLRTALANKRTNLAVRHADAIQQLTPETASLANLNYGIVRLLERGDR
jgi:hypothetical protein